MSYILDALKKSEQKRRQQGAVPDLLTVHDSKPLNAGKHTKWPYVLIGIVVLSIGALLWIFNKYAGKSNIEQAQVSARPPAQAPPAIAPETSDIAQSETSEKKPQKSEKKLPEAGWISEEKSYNPHADTPISTFRTSHDEVPSPSKQVTFKEYELPPEIQQALPKLTISALVYDENPSARIISLNGNLFHEGEIVAAGVRLESITANGVVFSYMGYRFYRPIF